MVAYLDIQEDCVVLLGEVLDVDVVEVNDHVLPAYKRALRDFKEPCLNVACSCNMRQPSSTRPSP